MRPYRTSDWPALLAAASDPGIWDQHPIHGAWCEETFRASIDRAVDDEGGLVAVDKTTGRIIGFSRFSTRHVEAGEIEIGWTFLVRSHWGGTFNREMKRLMLAHALASWPVVIFRIGAHNARSRRAMEKIGGVLLGRTEEIPWGGRGLPHVFYAIDRARFAACFPTSLAGREP